MTGVQTCALPILAYEKDLFSWIRSSVIGQNPVGVSPFWNSSISLAAPVMACRINSAWLMLQAESLSANSAYSSSVMRVLTTRLRCGVLYRFRMVKPPFCAWCPLTNRRKTGCEAELFLKNPKKYFEGFLSGASRISRVWGRHSPTRFPQGQNERKANFGTAVESCSVTAADCPCLVFPYIERTGRGFRPAVCYLFLLSI